MAHQPKPPLPQPQPDPDVAATLAAMGLSSDHLRDVVRDSNAQALECTSNDVANEAGRIRWAKPLRQLGDLYAPKGFTRKRPHNFELLVSPDKSFALTPAPGDRNTGTDRMPSTRIERGPLTGQAVVGNRHQLQLDGLGDELDEASMKIWLLLHYYDEAAEEIRLELSLPVEFQRKEKSERGTVTAFESRLRLPAITLVSGEDEDDEDEGGAIYVPVARR